MLELTLAEIDGGRGSAELERRGIRFATDTFTVGAHLIWGATFSILDGPAGAPSQRGAERRRPHRGERRPRQRQRELSRTSPTSIGTATRLPHSVQEPS